MKKINVGIVGYGNLGKGVESAIMHSEHFKLVRIFSNRTGLTSPFNTKFEQTKNLEKYEGKIDTLFLCGGSYSDIEKIGPRAIEKFNTVDSFDTHAKLEKYINDLDKLAKDSKKVAVSAAGWDPGLMSMMRLIFNSISPVHTPANSFWGMGVSQGHSDAIRRIEGVKNAIQYTVPNKKIVKNCQTQFDYVPQGTEKHERHCYVVLEPGADANKIKEEIVNMPNYFLGYKTIVKFINEDKLKKMQQKMFHKGYVVKNFKCSDQHATQMSFNLDLESNPFFTSEVMVTLACAVSKLAKEEKFGAYSVFDIPLSHFVMNDRNELLRTLL